MNPRVTTQRPIRAKLIFNAASGRTEESPERLVEILTELQAHSILPEVTMVGADSDVAGTVRGAIRAGIRLVVVAGGDGTIDSVVGALAGSPARLGIIPIGTRNNVAFNLGIPAAVPEAVALLRAGRQVKVDVGYMRSGRSSRWFLEAASLGLITDLYPGTDQLQHGDLTQIGNLLSTFVSSTPAGLHAVLGDRQRYDASAYMVLIANMPYLGPRLQIAPHISCRDGRLDVFIYSDMTKLDLVSVAMRSAAGPVVDPHLKHYRVSHLAVRSEPPMPALADGVLLERGAVSVRVHARALRVIAGAQGPAIESSRRREK